MRQTAAHEAKRHRSTSGDAKMKTLQNRSPELLLATAYFRLMDPRGAAVGGTGEMSMSRDPTGGYITRRLRAFALRKGGVC